MGGELVAEDHRLGEEPLRLVDHLAGADDDRHLPVVDRPRQEDPAVAPRQIDRRAEGGQPAGPVDLHPPCRLEREHGGRRHRLADKEPRPGREKLPDGEMVKMEEALDPHRPAGEPLGPTDRPAERFVVEDHAPGHGDDLPVGRVVGLMARWGAGEDRGEDLRKEQPSGGHQPKDDHEGGVPWTVHRLPLGRNGLERPPQCNRSAQTRASFPAPGRSWCWRPPPVDLPPGG